MKQKKLFAWLGTISSSIRMTEIKEFEILSYRTKEILKEADLTLKEKEFLELESWGIYRLKNCGAKPAEELIKLQYKLKSDIEPPPEIREDTMLVLQQLNLMKSNFAKPTFKETTLLGS